MTPVQLDLNLLTALDALLEEGSVAGAADRLHLTPPAMSRALSRIRRVTGDQILVRTGRTMTPTPHALAIREQVHLLVQEVSAVLAPEREVDLATLERTFTLQWHDAITVAAGPRVLAAVRAQAPGVRLRMIAESDTDTSHLRHGHVDLEVSATQPVAPEVRGDTVGHDRLVVATGTRRGLGLDEYVAADHLTVSRRGRLHDPIDDALGELGLRRRVIATVPTSSAGLKFVRDSDILVAVPERMSRDAAADLGLRLLPLPLDFPPVPIVMSWHQRYDTDRAHTWLRELVRAELAR